jgi:hypothetical protein
MMKKTITVQIESEYPYRFDEPIHLYDQAGFWIGDVVKDGQKVED